MAFYCSPIRFPLSNPPPLPNSLYERTLARSCGHVVAKFSRFHELLHILLTHSDSRSSVNIL